MIARNSVYFCFFSTLCSELTCNWMKSVLASFGKILVSGSNFADIKTFETKNDKSKHSKSDIRKGYY